MPRRPGRSDIITPTRTIGLRSLPAAVPDCDVGDVEQRGRSVGRARLERELGVLAQARGKEVLARPVAAVGG